ncbi:hypothetical protein BDW59DRAFT_64335 [Aspergillus cavernicola]|uniref:DUF7580 domain-containing protein n=1 Tax=Aspergillus cavernicola TaxID=176166 RepID=A0ABR4J1C2_9EURO
MSVMALNPEDAQRVHLLLGVLQFFGSDLPVSKQAAESDAKLRWPQQADFKEEIERIRNYFDDFCVEVGLIELGLKSYYANNASGSSVELSSIAERMLGFLEALLNRDSATQVGVSPAIHFYYIVLLVTDNAGKLSSEPFLKVRRLHQLVASANKLGRTFADIDGLYPNGSVKFSVDQREAKRALEVLQRCRSVICDSFHDTLGPTRPNDNDDDDDDDPVKHMHKARLFLRTIRALSSLVDRFPAHAPAPSPMVCIVREPTSPKIDTVAFWKHSTSGEHNWLVSKVLITPQEGVRFPTRGRVRFSNSADVLGAPSVDPPPRLYTICEILQHIQEGGSITGAGGPDRVVFNSREHTFSLTNIVERRSTSFISLRTLLQRQSLSPSERAFLAATVSEFILTVGELWHESRCVSMSNTFYLPLVEGTQGQANVSVTQPFFAIDPREQEGQGQEARLQHCFHSHSFVLDLGILLIELNYNTTIETLRKAHDPETIYTKYATAWELIESQGFEEKVVKSHQSAIKACLRCDFLPHDARPGGKQFQFLVYEHILRPLRLQEYLDVMDEHVEDSDNHPEKVRSPDTNPSPTAEPLEPSHSQWKKLGVVLEERLQVFDEPNNSVSPTA